MLKSDIMNLINKINGKFFTVTFYKKDGTKRVMNARTGVTKYIKDTGQSKPNHLLTVYDINKKGYRTIRFNSIESIKFNKELYNFKTDSII